MRWWGVGESGLFFKLGVPPTVSGGYRMEFLRTFSSPKARPASAHELGLLAALAVVSGHALRMPQLVQRWHAQLRCAEPVLQAADQLENHRRPQQ